MKLCILRPNNFSYSETFIDNQVNNLNPSFILYESWYPSILPSGKSFLKFPLNFQIIRGSIRNIFPKLYNHIYNILLKKFILRNQIDILLANYGPMGVSVNKTCKAIRIPLVVHFHGFDAYHYDTLKKYGDEYLNVFKNATLIIAVSQDMRKQLISLGADSNKVKLNPYGVDLELFGGAFPETSATIFVYVGRFTAKKSPDNTIKAFKRVLEKVPDAKLITVGDGELFDEIVLLAKKLGIEKNVEFKGRKTPLEIAEILKHARCFIQHSVRASNGDAEGTPNTILEACATGLPVVSTTHAGIKDAIIHGKTGFLVAEGDWEEMANYMIRLAEDRILAGQMGKAARKHIEEFYSMEKRINMLKQILLDAQIINQKLNNDQ